MLRAVPFGVLTLALALLLATPIAHAQVASREATPVYVLTLRTDDADDQAEALTQALRARLRAMTPAWTLLETTQSFETLSIALRCPPNPDPACLARIADQLHADHYIWGTAARSRGEVTAELNLWRRSGGGSEASARFPDALKDPESPRLRAVAVRLLQTLTSAPLEATSGVAAAEEGGPGPTDLAPRTTPTTATPEPAAADRAQTGFRKGLGYAGLATGALLLVAGGVELGRWVGDKHSADQDRADVPMNVTDVCAAPGNSSAATACQALRRETTDAVFGWVFTITGAALAGTGTWLLVSSGRSGPRPTVARVPIEIVPTLGSHARSLELRATF